MPSARDSFTDLITWLGLITDPKKAQDPTAFEDASGTLGVDSFALCSTPERIQTVRSELLCVRDVPVLHLGELARLRGKLIHLAGTMAGRVGASLTYQCTYHITKDITVPSSALRREIDWVLALLARAPWRVVHLSMPHQGVTVISDASWSIESSLPQSRLCFWVFAASRPPFGRVLDVPGWFIDVLPPRETHIMVTEPLMLYPGLFKRTAVTFFVGNQSALMSLVKAAVGQWTSTTFPWSHMQRFSH